VPREKVVDALVIVVVSLPETVLVMVIALEIVENKTADEAPGAILKGFSAVDVINGVPLDDSEEVTIIGGVGEGGGGVVVAEVVAAGGSPVELD